MSSTYTPDWNLATIPADAFARERARRVAAKRKTHAGGRPPVERPCLRCGALCASARASRSHCVTTAAAPASPEAQADTATPSPRPHSDR